MGKFQIRHLQVFFWIFFSTMLSFFVQGQAMEPTSNWFPYLPLMHSIRDSSLYPADDFVPLLSRTPSWFWWILGKLLPFEHSYLYLFLLNFITRLASGFLLYRMTSFLAKDARAGFIAVLLLAGQADTVIGRGDINWPYYTHTALSIPILLFSLDCLIRAKYRLAFAVAGFCWNIHLLNAAYYSLFLAFWMVFHYKTMGRKTALQSILLSALFAIPILPPLLSGFTQSQVSPLWMEYALYFHSHLLSPFSQPYQDWIRFAGYLVLFLFIRRSHPEENWKRLSTAMLLMWGTLYLSGVLLIEIFTASLFIKLQPFRCTDLLILLFFTGMSVEIFKGLQGNSLTGRALHLGLLTLLLFFNLRTQPSALKDILTGIWWLLILMKIWGSLPGFRSRHGVMNQLYPSLIWGTLLYLALLLPLFSAWTVHMFPNLTNSLYTPSILWSTWGLLIALVYLVHFLYSVPGHLTSRRMKALTLILCLWIGLEHLYRISGTAWERYRTTGHPIFLRYHPLFFKAAHWCRQNTPPDALFIIPPYRGGFRAESLRSVFVSWDEHHAIMVAPDYIPEYDHRLRLLGIIPNQDGNLPREWHPTRDQILKVREDYGADYLIIESHKLMPFRPIHFNIQYTIYQLD